MKIQITISLIFISMISFSQDMDRMNEIMNIINSQDSISRDLFLDSAVIKNMDLLNSINWRHVWTDIDDDIKSIHQFYDIRLKFDSDSAALAFHQKYMPENSEDGPEIKKHKIKIDGLVDLHVFTQNPAMSKMFLEPYGFQALCYLFVVDNYFVKFYITCLKEYKPDHFTPYIEDVINKITKHNTQ